jgi:hypothetical protein
MRLRTLVLALAPVLVAASSLTACDEAEQGRILQYKKGTYLGKKDQPLSEAEQDELRQRTRLQQGS